MALTMLRTSTARAALRASTSASARTGMGSLSFTRGKATLPDLPCSYPPLLLPLPD